MAGLSELQKTMRVYSDEPWSEQHNEVMRNHDEADALGENVKLGMFFYDRIVSRLKAADYRTFEDASTLYKTLLVWHHASLTLVRRIDDSESRGFPVDDAELLRDAFREVSSIADKVNGRIAALDMFIAGKGISAKEFLNELRSRRSPRREELPSE